MTCHVLLGHACLVCRKGDIDTCLATSRVGMTRTWQASKCCIMSNWTVYALHFATTECNAGMYTNSAVNVLENA